MPWAPPLLKPYYVLTRQHTRICHRWRVTMYDDIFVASHPFWFKRRAVKAAEKEIAYIKKHGHGNGFHLG